MLSSCLLFLLLFTAVLQPYSSLFLPKSFCCLILHLMLLLILNATDHSAFWCWFPIVRVFSHRQIWVSQLIAILPAPLLPWTSHCTAGKGIVLFFSPSTNWWFPPEHKCCVLHPLLQPKTCMKLCMQWRAITKHLIRFATHNLRGNQTLLC